MAKESRGSSGFLWLLIGIILGVAGAVAVYVLVNRPAAEAPVDALAPSVKMETPALPPEPLPPPVAPPVAAKPAVTVQPHSAQSDDQIADDAAATGMTGPATPPPADPGPATN